MSLKPIDSEEITVVVQGPVIDRTRVSKVLQSVRASLPHSQIILSTWKHQAAEVEGWDLCVESEDPGPLVDLNLRPCNYRRQALSTARGLEAATRRFSLKIRVDTPITAGSMCVFDDEWCYNPFPPFKGKLVMPNVCVRDPLKFPQNYSLCDITQFGLTEDLRTMWEAARLVEDEAFAYGPDFKPGYWGNYIGYSRLRSVAEQTLLIALLNREGAFAGPVGLTGPCDMSFENFRRARAVLKRAVYLIDFRQCGVEVPKRTWSPWFVRTSFVRPCHSLYLSDYNDRMLWLLAISNKYLLALMRASYWTPALSHAFFRYCPSLGTIARRCFHRLRGDTAFGSGGIRA